MSGSKNKISLLALATKLQWKIVDGGEYLWESFGSNCRIVSFTPDHYNEMWCVQAIFDVDTLDVREITGHGSLFLMMRENPWMWINPEYREKYLEESANRGHAAFKAWDDVYYDEVDLEGADSMMSLIVNEKAENNNE